jgi:putative transposase
MQKSLDACRWVYNKTLEVRKAAWEERQESLSRYDTFKMLPQWKLDNSGLTDAHSQSLQEACTRVDLAFQAFFRRVKAGGEKPGYPRFKSFDRYDSFTYPQSGFRLLEKQLELSKIGLIKIRKHREIEGEIKTLTIHRTATSKWYACFSCEVEPNPLPKTEAVVGIDVGLESFATFSTGKKIENPRFFRKSEKCLAKAQRKLSKQKMGTPERKKAKKAVAHVHENIANKRRDFAHKASRNIVNNYQVIALEKLDIKQMRENGFKGIRKSIGDVAWNQFVQFTQYKAEGANREFVQVNPRNTSKMCSRCGQLVEKKLSTRVHVCPHCGLILDRDENAAINILRLGIQSLGLSLDAP